MFVRFIGLGLSSAALIAATAPALAESADTVSKDIRFGDLNLTTDAGVKSLTYRVKHAARAICYYDGRDLGMRAKANDCFKTAMTGASHQIELAIANAKSGQQQAMNSIQMGTLAR